MSTAAPPNADEGDQKHLGLAPDDTPVKEEELDLEARAMLTKMLDEYTQMFLSTYEHTRTGGLRQRYPCPRTIMLDANRRPRDEDMIINHVPGGNLSRMIHDAVHQAMINQAPALVNTCTMVADQVIRKELFGEEYQRGPAYLTKEEIKKSAENGGAVPTKVADPSTSLPIILAPAQANQQYEGQYRPQTPRPNQPPAIGQYPQEEQRNRPNQPPPIGQYPLGGQYDRPIERQQIGQRDQQEELKNTITELMMNRFGLQLKEQAFMHGKPYPAWYDDVPIPQRYKVPEFTKFTGQDNMSTGEHIT